jgi:hypothetical protein
MRRNVIKIRVNKIMNKKTDIYSKEKVLNNIIDRTYIFTLTQKRSRYIQLVTLIHFLKMQLNHQVRCSGVKAYGGMCRTLSR